MVEETLRIALIPGDGIGQEVVPAAQAALVATGLPLTFVRLDAGWETFQAQGTALPTATIDALRNCAGALFGAVSSPSQRVAGYSSPIIGLRKQFDLYANLRPVVSAPVAGSQPDVDLLIVRENTECLYVKQERWVEEGETALAERIISRRASTRIAHTAFQQARQRHIQHPQRPPLVTIVHKANVLSLTDGLFRECALGVAQAYPDVQVEEQLVDSMVYHLIRSPQRYDVVVAPNLYGDILSDAAAALVGGLGLAPSANVGTNFVVAEPVHGSAPDIAGQGIANPLATILAAALLLESIGQPTAAQQLQQAVQQVLQHGPWSRDLGGDATTAQVTQAVVAYL
ncbi:MAG: isocitrate/isopropylmalate dehydrogenase family protein [Caldilineaceae bacterium]|nr:isocitrate/isopropylmalate dehydrogenase family protein [Caldilineaceae bacterium]